MILAAVTPYQGHQCWVMMWLEHVLLHKPFDPCHCPTVDTFKKVVNEGHWLRRLTALIAMRHCVVAIHELVCKEETSAERQR